MFFMAYSLEDVPDQSPRPVTFLWNGGPGSSSSLVHLLGFGPKRIDRDGELRPNEGTWLETSDLVFVDPIGTRYSRPTKAEYAAEFYQDRGDAESVAEFIRVYLTRANAWDAPVFLAGESFGVLRATRVTDVLQRKGIPVTGIMFIGLVPRLAPVTAEVETALAVPTFAATAFYHQRLAPDLQSNFDETLREAETWALERYAPALARAPSSVDIGDLRAGLTRLTGVDGRAIDSTLIVGMGPFTKALLREDMLVVGRYDSRVTGPLDTTEVQYDPTIDPSLMSLLDDVGVVRYMRDELGYRSDLRYQGPFGGGYPPPDSPRGDWMSVRWDRSESGRAPVDDQTSDPTPSVERLMRSDEDLHVYSGCGYYDLVCSYAVIEYMAAKLDPALASRLTVRSYHGGHAIYTDRDARMQMKADVTSFIRNARGGRPR